MQPHLDAGQLKLLECWWLGGERIKTHVLIFPLFLRRNELIKKRNGRMNHTSPTLQSIVDFPTATIGCLFNSALHSNIEKLAHSRSFCLAWVVWNSHTSTVVEYPWSQSLVCLYYWLQCLLLRTACNIAAGFTVSLNAAHSSSVQQWVMLIFSPFDVFTVSRQTTQM